MNSEQRLSGVNKYMEAVVKMDYCYKIFAHHQEYSLTAILGTSRTNTVTYVYYYIYEPTEQVATLSRDARNIITYIIIFQSSFMPRLTRAPCIQLLKCLQTNREKYICLFF